MDHAVCAVLAIVGLGALCSCLCAAPVRVHARFDEGWRFHRGDLPDAHRAEFDDSAWRQVDLPHDWSVEDLPTEDLPPALAIAQGTWRFRAGDDPSWKDPNLDDSGWQTVELPAHWESHGNQGDNAYGWFRRRIEIPGEMRGKDLLLVVGKVDDVDETFVNGQKVGGLGSFPPNYVSAWQEPRRYRVPANLLRGDGTDLVAVRVYDGDGPGGLYEAVAAPVRSGPFDSEAEGKGAVGYTVGGVGWYRKSFTVPEEFRGKRFKLTFDGIYMNAQVWLNGLLVGRHPYGYTAFTVDLNPYLRIGGATNVIAVRVDASGRTSRWFPGAGIYRHTWFTATEPVHVPVWGIAVTTPEVSAEQAKVHVATTVRNEGGEQAQVTVTSEIVNEEDTIIAKASTEVSVARWGNEITEQELTLAAPALWSVESPALYKLRTSLSVQGRLTDQVETTFGVRSVEFSAVKGFLLNGEPLKLRGGCVHHDNGCLGACAYDRAEERRVELLKAAGFNAVRTAHNPPSPAFLDACDRLGVLVIDEAFDCWRKGKNPDDYHRFFDTYWRQDIEAMVRRDRNHPSVIMWSIGNEVLEQGSPEGVEICKMLSDYVHTLDPSRPTTIGAHPGTDPWENLDAMFACLAVCGYNYKWDRYALDHQRVPARVIVGTESFPNQCFESWMATLDNDHVIGDFVWTAFDYLGEVALGHTYYEGEPILYGAWPWTAANCGDLDLCGFRRPQSYYRNAVWGVGDKVSCFVQAPLPPGKTRELVYGWGWPDVRPSWTWPGQEGKPLLVHVYSSCPRVRLVVNHRDVGVKDTNRETRFTATWEVPYVPGELAAMGLDDQGNEVARWVLRTAGQPAAIRLTPDRDKISTDSEDLSFVTVEVIDVQGVVDPNADNLIRFSVSGPGAIVGVGSGDPRSIESFQQPQRKAWRGRCLVVIRGEGREGTIRLAAEADGLKSAETQIRVGD